MQNRIERAVAKADQASAGLLDVERNLIPVPGVRSKCGQDEQFVEIACEYLNIEIVGHPRLLSDGSPGTTISAPYIS
jgi:hypothetical protein